MPQKRLLALGTTGIDKKTILSRLKDYCTNHSHACRILDFERDYLFPNAGGSASFLDNDLRSQRRFWEHNWGLLKSEFEGDRENDLFLSLHGCYIRGHYGSRIVFDVSRVAEFKPDLIVTLIADVYDCWWRTEARASGEAWKGRPTLEQLVLARRFEVAAGDQIALAADCKHLVLAVAHPCDTLARCLYRRDPWISYLSFPISEPRRMAKAGNQEGIQQVSEFIARAHAKQKMSQRLSCVCPLAIDELPFKKIDVFGKLEEEFIKFDRDHLRWDMGAFWPETERLGVQPPPGAEFSVKQFNEAIGSMQTDVGWRDYRLAEQAHGLMVFNPVFNNTGSISHGVLNEITFATRHNLPVYIYQDEAHDNEGALGKWLDANGPGTMGTNPSSNRIIVKESLDELLNVAE